MVVAALACLPEEIYPCAILPLGPLHTDPVLRHPGSSYAAVGGAHQSYRNPTIDVSARLRVGFFTLWPGDWLTFSGLSSPPPPAFHPPRRQKGRSAGAAGGKPPGTSSFFPVPPCLGTSLDPSSCASGCRCSRHACRGHCLSPASRGHGSAGRPSIP